MDIQDLVDTIRSLPGCTLQPSLGLPIVCEQHVLPDDLKQFYRLCGGATLYEGEPSDPVEIVPPYKVVLANAIQLVGLDDEEITWYKNRQSIIWSWYIIADYGNSNYVAIDLSQERLGQCYDANHELYPDCPIIANSFTELLEWLIEKWDRTGDPQFEELGDPFEQP